MKNKHTPTPFKQGYNNNQVIWADYKRVATMDCSNKDWKSNAEFIVKACNSHYELVEALKEVRQVLGSINEEYNIDLSDIENDIERTLQKAEG